MPMILDSSRAPLFIATAFGILTDDDYAQGLARWTEEAIKPGKPYAFAYDGTGIVRMARSQIKLQSDWVNQHRDALRVLVRGGGFALDSAFTRSLLRVVNWWAPPGYPFSVFATREEAIAWALRQLTCQPCFGDQFRMLRQELAGKQTVLVAAGLRCTDAAISLWEKGQRLPSQRMLERVIGVFAQLGAREEDIEKLRAAWTVEREERKERRLQTVQSA